MDGEVFVHPQAIVDEGAEIGVGSRIWAGAHVMSGVRVGRKCNIGENCFIEDGVTVGDGVTVKNNVALYSGAEIGDDVFLGPSCVFTNVVNPRSFISRKSAFKKTIVKCGATIGANATVVCGHKIGCYAFVGAGSVVTKDVPDYACVYGCPAVIRGWVCRCGVKLSFQDGEAACPECGERYCLEAGVVSPSTHDQPCGKE